MLWKKIPAVQLVSVWLRSQYPTVVESPWLWVIDSCLLAPHLSFSAFISFLIILINIPNVVPLPELDSLILGTHRVLEGCQACHCMSCEPDHMIVCMENKSLN